MHKKRYQSIRKLNNKVIKKLSPKMISRKNLKVKLINPTYLKSINYKNKNNH